MPDLFKDWISSINEKTSDVYEDGDIEDLNGVYPAFMINRAFSQTSDTILAANAMNAASKLPGNMQYDFLMHAIPKKKRFAKWAKAESSERIDIIMSAYDVGVVKAREYSRLISDSDLEKLKEYIFEGGRNVK